MSAALLLAVGGEAAAQRPGAPAIISAAAGDKHLAVAWTGPDDSAAPPVTSYDLRYVATGAPDDAEWTEQEAVWTSGELLYTLSGLDNEVSYDVEVRAVGSDGPGEWSVTASGTPVDPGDTLTTAAVLEPGASVAAVIDPGDADIFKLEMSGRNGLLVLTRGDLDTVGELLDRDGDRVAYNDDGYAVHGFLNFLISETLPAGVYYLKVTSFKEAGGDYVLETRVLVDSTGRDDAQPIDFDGGFFNGILESAADVDWFSFTLAEETPVIVRSSALVDGEIQDADGERISGEASIELPHSGFVHSVTLPAGSYYIEVTGFGVFGGLYTVYLLEAPEPGDSLETAVALRFYRVAAGTIDPSGDADYFRIDLDRTTPVELSARGESVDLAGQLLDSRGDPIDDAVLVEAFTGPLGFVLRDVLAGGTYYIKVTRSGDGYGDGTGPYAVFMSTDVVYGEFLDYCAALTTDAGDPLYGCQWHLNNTGQRGGGPAGEDIRVEEAWAVTRGDGVNVAIVDDGLDGTHRDLRDNVNPDRNHDYTGLGSVYAGGRSHGTRVAGLIAARDNSIGMRGVAPHATIHMHNLLQSYTVFNAADAMTRNMADTAVSNNSWGPGDISVPVRADEFWALAVESAVSDGFAGKGVFFAWAAGNGADNGDYGTIDEYANHYAVTAVCAVNDLGRRTYYSEMGANLWVCAPSSDSTLERPGIATTAERQRYTGGFTGTSAATPQVAGVAALVRSVDGSLSWRDVKLILAASARKNDPDSAGWETGAPVYGAPSERYEFNHEYGFGVVDAAAAVDLAGDWVNVPAMRSSVSDVAASALAVPTDGREASSSVSLEPNLDFVEFVEVNAVFDAPDFRNLRIELVSPSGAVSVLSVPESEQCPYYISLLEVQLECELVGRFRFGSARHLGEDPSGLWTLRLFDEITGGPTNRLESWSITAYGHRATTDAPTLLHVDPGDGTLTSAWTAPDYRGLSPVAGYDVRHVASDAADKADAAWTVVEGAAPAGASQFMLSGLENGVRHDVQVRAVNDAGGGPWSITGRGVPGAANSEPFFVESARAVRTVAETAASGERVAVAMAARDAESDTFTYSVGEPDAALFGIDAATGHLLVMGRLDHETEAVHVLEVSVSDGKDAAGDPDLAVDATIAVTVTVEDVDEAPEVTGAPTLQMAENLTTRVTPFSGVDPEGGPLSWRLDGIDKDNFFLYRRELWFRAPPDYENPADGDLDNVYELVVVVSDGPNSTSADLRVTVVDVDESGHLSLSSQAPEVGSELVATLFDPDEGSEATDWYWFRYRDTPRASKWIDEASSSTYTPVEADKGHFLRVAVAYVDKHASHQIMSSGTSRRVAAAPDPPPAVRPAVRPAVAQPAVPDPPPPHVERFVDVDAAGTHSANIDALFAAGVTRGCGHAPLRFCPHAGVTRAQMASFLTRALDLPEPAAPAGFADVGAAGTHSANIDALFAAGVTRGCGHAPLRFCPHAGVTRAQMASFLTRALDLPEPAAPAGFADVGAAGTHSANIDALFAAGVTRGCGHAPLRFCPHAGVTRAQMASFLTRALASRRRLGPSRSGGRSRAHPGRAQTGQLAGTDLGCIS